MKLTHADAADLISAANDILDAFERFADATIDAAMMAGTVDAIRQNVVNAASSYENRPSLDAMTRIRMEREFYARNALRLQKQADAVARFRQRKRAGWNVKPHVPHIRDGAHANSVAPSDRTDKFAAPREPFLGRAKPSARKIFLDETGKATAVEIPIDTIDNLPVYALANTIEEYTRLKAEHDAEHGIAEQGEIEPPPPSRPVFAVEESQRAKESDATDELEF